MSTCRSKSSGGKQCAKQAVSGSTFCWFHDPKRAKERVIWQRKVARTKRAVRRGRRRTAKDGTPTGLRIIVAMPVRGLHEAVRAKVREYVEAEVGNILKEVLQ